jgi:hypothetical protein
LPPKLVPATQLKIQFQKIKKFAFGYFWQQQNFIGSFQTGSYDKKVSVCRVA